MPKLRASQIRTEEIKPNVPNVDTTNAANISSGSLDGDRLPALSVTKKGGVPATGSPSGKYLKDDGTWSAVVASQPDITMDKLSPSGDISITSGYSAIVVGSFEIASGYVLDILSSSVFCIL